MKGAYEAEQSLYSYVPKVAPRPLAWGTYESDSDTQLYMCEFMDMSGDIPSSRESVAAVVKLHLTTMGKSPTGQFGFHVTTHLGNVPIGNSWDP